MSSEDLGHNEPCYWCKKPINSFAADAIPLCHKEEPGKVKWHHSGCVSERLIENIYPGQIIVNENTEGLIVVPLCYLRDVRRRFRQLTELGQSKLADWLVLSKDMRELKAAIFTEAEFGAILAGQWLQKNGRR